jgi:hypothetical protein
MPASVGSSARLATRLLLDALVSLGIRIVPCCVDMGMIQLRMTCNSDATANNLQNGVDGPEISRKPITRMEDPTDA